MKVPDTLLDEESLEALRLVHLAGCCALESVPYGPWLLGQGLLVDRGTDSLARKQVGLSTDGYTALALAAPFDGDDYDPFGSKLKDIKYDVRRVTGSPTTIPPPTPPTPAPLAGSQPGSWTPAIPVSGPTPGTPAPSQRSFAPTPRLLPPADLYLDIAPKSKLQGLRQFDLQAGVTYAFVDYKGVAINRKVLEVWIPKHSPQWTITVEWDHGKTINLNRRQALAYICTELGTPRVACPSGNILGCDSDCEYCAGTGTELVHSQINVLNGF